MRCTIIFEFKWLISHLTASTRRNIRRLRWLESHHWRNLQNDKLNEPPGAQFCRISAKQLRGKRDHSEWACLKLLLVPRADLLDFVSDRLERHTKRCRSERVSESEFWIAFALWLSKQVMLGQNHHHLSPSMYMAVERLQNSMPKDRLQAILSAFSFSEPHIVRLIKMLADRTNAIVTAGYLFIVDESILNSESKVATRQGMLKQIDGKPHSRGYFFHCGIQKTLFSHCVLVFDVEIKWSRQTGSMYDCAVSIVERCEKRYKRPFVVCLDNGYPASYALMQDHPHITSKFICSVSNGKVSGVLRGLVQTADATMSIGEKVTLVCDAPSLVAFIWRKRTITICLVTNAYGVKPPEDIEEQIEPKFRGMSYSQVFCLYNNFSPGELQLRFGFPHLDDDSTRGEPRYYWKYLRRVTGVDLALPSDFEGVVTEASLRPLDLKELKEMARLNNINLRAEAKRKQVVEAIVRHHPANLAMNQRSEARIKDPPPKDTTAVLQAQRDLRRIYSDLKHCYLQDTSAPNFYEQYVDNYGLEDRLNAQIYRNFKHTISKTPAQKLTWAVFYLFLINARTIFLEHSLSGLQDVEKVRAARAHLPPLAVFCASIVEQIADAFGD